MTDPALFAVPPERRMFCNRTLNMRSIQAVGFDMDYTLVHYDVHEWEARAYAHVQQRLLALGHPVGELSFDPEQYTRGLVLDLTLGNLVKANRFGYVVQAAHGTRMLAHEEQRRVYSQVWVDLAEPRWLFLNTLFSLSEACLYAQLVDLFDAGRIDASLLGGDQFGAGLDYAALHALVSHTMDAAHLEGELKAEIIADPERFVKLDPDLPQTLLDLKHAGKKLFLATNSEWSYTVPMMRYAFDRALPGGDWRALFDLVIVQAHKPAFFDAAHPFALVDPVSGSTTPHTGPLSGRAVYAGGNAQLVQEHFALDGSDILYVGDHAYADIHVSSRIRRWRTVLILRELEREVREEQAFAGERRQLLQLMAEKERLDQEQAMLRLALLRFDHGGDPPPGAGADA
ncbi:MAG: HAD-IG family 5'-nucleotidase, partial [Planctomycetes bacterium]|nr:HAD-IG family 5'-nucleotidase [Planctomycetota bacterium]